jgi:hypothetical protein
VIALCNQSGVDRGGAGCHERLCRQTARPRARGAFGGEPGPLNAITDVPGVEVGHSTIVSGFSGSNEPVARTGVTAVLPRGRPQPDERGVRRLV